MRRTFAALALVVAAAAAAFGQTNAGDARRELDEGARAYRYGKFEEAEQHFRRALELDPEGKNTRVFIARAAQQQYKPGVETPENVAAGERAVAAYQEVLAREPANEDAYKAVAFLYGQMKQDDKLRELLLSRANDFNVPDEKRSEAFTLLASKQWQCSYDVTERKENKATETQPDKVVIRYKMPADSGDFMRARECVSLGLQFAEQAVSLAPKNPNALSYKANLLREAAKLAEMEGDAGQSAEYNRQYGEALETQKRLADEVYQVAGTGTRPDSAPGEPKPIQGGVLNGKAVSKPQPAYPPVAKAARASGTVTVRILVDEDGRVIEAEAVGGHPLLQQAAVAAARQARFSPTLLSGQRVKVAGVVTYNFVLQ
ncbi:MAG TPA: TonB family protein [Pyrinomonadaceae bacterium]|nr:TonB family protein [Pyrinomonadaceae bacterium]